MAASKKTKLKVLENLLKQLEMAKTKALIEMVLLEIDIELIKKDLDKGV